MANLPQLLEEDVSGLNDALHELLLRSEATAALLIDIGGFLITTAGELETLDTVTLSALAAASFAATQGLAVQARQAETEPDVPAVAPSGKTDEQPASTTSRLLEAKRKAQQRQKP